MQLIDTGQETNGLLTANRTFKLDPTQLRAIVTRVAEAVPGDLTVPQQGDKK
jgi:hypothetical protein